MYNRNFTYKNNKQNYQTNLVLIKICSRDISLSDNSTGNNMTSYIFHSMKIHKFVRELSHSKADNILVTAIIVLS